MEREKTKMRCLAVLSACVLAACAVLVPSSSGSLARGSETAAVRSEMVKSSGPGVLVPKRLRLIVGFVQTLPA